MRLRARTHTRTFTSGNHISLVRDTLDPLLIIVDLLPFDSTDACHPGMPFDGAREQRVVPVGSAHGRAAR